MRQVSFNILYQFYRWVNQGTELVSLWFSKPPSFPGNWKSPPRWLALSHRVSQWKNLEVESSYSHSPVLPHNKMLPFIVEVKSSISYWQSPEASLPTTFNKIGICSYTTAACQEEQLKKTLYCSPGKLWPILHSCSLTLKGIPNQSNLTRGIVYAEKTGVFLAQVS